MVSRCHNLSLGHSELRPAGRGREELAAVVVANLRGKWIFSRAPWRRRRRRRAHAPSVASRPASCVLVAHASSASCDSFDHMLDFYFIAEGGEAARAAVFRDSDDEQQALLRTLVVRRSSEQASGNWKRSRRHSVRPSDRSTASVRQITNGHVASQPAS